MLARIWDAVWWWFLHATGADNPSGVEYGFWSGWGSDIPIFVAFMTFGKLHFNCHERGCLRIGRHHYEDANGMRILLCPKHHPHHPGKKVSLAEHAAADAASRALATSSSVPTATGSNGLRKTKLGHTE